MPVSIRGACAWRSLACFGIGSRRVCTLWLTSLLPAGQLGPKLLRGRRDVGICGNLQAHHGDAAACACRARGGRRGLATPHRMWLTHAAGGAQLHNGRRHPEIVSEVSGERISSLTGGNYRVAQRHAIIKRSDCWVTFWSFQEDGQKRRMNRQKGSFRKVADYRRRIVLGRCHMGRPQANKPAGISWLRSIARQRPVARLMIGGSDRSEMASIQKNTGTGMSPLSRR